MATSGGVQMYSNNRESGWPASTTVFESGARTATVSSAFKENPGNYRGIKLFVEVASVTDTPSVVFTVEVKNHRTGTYHTVLASAAVVSAVNTVYEVYPAGAATANVRATFHIGRGFRVTATHADADSITYGVWAEWIP